MMKRLRSDLGMALDLWRCEWSRVFRRLRLLLLFGLLCWVLGCQSVHSAPPTSQPQAKPQVVSVTINPTSAAIQTVQTQQFTATVTGTTDTSVMWQVDSVSGGSTATGTVTAGLYTAPSAAGSHTVTAVSMADPTQSAGATVTVSAAPPPPPPPPPPPSAISVLTGRYDNARTGLNSSETVLNPSNVTTSGFGKLASYSIDGMAFAQPLYVPNVTIPNQGTFNVVYVATQHDSVYAFDADGKATSPLWHTSFINPAAGTTTILQGTVGSTIYPEIGITSTPVIDPNTGVLYVVPFTEENGTFELRLHALSISTGKDVNVPMEIAAPGFDPKVEAQRPALLLVNSTLYIAFASHGDNGKYHGRILAYDPQTLTLKNDWNVTPNGAQGGIWQSGCGLSADSSGNVYAATSNGTFDINKGGTDYGDSVVKLDATLNVLDYFTPSDQQLLDDHDVDLGSSGFMLIPGTTLGVVAGKGGTIYLVDTTSMGQFNGTIDNIVQELPGALGTGTEDLNFSTATFFNGNIYYGGQYDTLKQFSFNGQLSTTPVNHTAHTYGYRGVQSAVSSNGTSNGILWVAEWIASGGNGVLWAYDATDVSKELYDSNQAGSRDTFGQVTKFSVPTIANGKVYVGAEKRLVIFGLL